MIFVFNIYSYCNATQCMMISVNEKISDVKSYMFMFLDISLKIQYWYQPLFFSYQILSRFEVVLIAFERPTNFQQNFLLAARLLFCSVGCRPPFTGCQKMAERRYIRKYAFDEKQIYEVPCWRRKQTELFRIIIQMWHIIACNAM